MTLKEIAKAIGGTIRDLWINVPGPGHSSSDRSLGIRFDEKEPDGFRVHSFSGDDEKQCREYVKGLLDTSTSGSKITLSDALAINQNVKAKQAAAIKLWSESVAIDDTAAAYYLTARGCLGEDTTWKQAIRFHPSCPFGNHKFPAMVALVRNVVSGESQGIHRTALKDDGSGKRAMPGGMNAKMIMGTASNGAVMLSALAAHIGIAEGIETALSAQKSFKVPVWAALSANGVGSFPVIWGVKELTIFADHDEAGLNAAKDCGARYLHAHVLGKIHHPPVYGTDWNDNLQKKSNENV